MIKVPLVISIVVITMAVLFFWGWFSANLVIKIPRLPIETTPDDYGLSYETIVFSSSDGIELNGWFIPYKNAQTIIILLHGWGANKGCILPNGYFLNHRGHYNLFLFDYRAHGQSAGKYTTLGCMERLDLIAAVDYLKKSRPGAAVHIGILGVSLGGAVGILAAAEHAGIDAVIAESTFCDPVDVIARYAKLFYGIPRYPLISVMMFFAELKAGVRFKDYRAFDYVGRIAPRPVLIIQGAEDLRMPVAEGKELFRRAGEPKQMWTVPGADHGEAYLRQPVEYEKRVLDFFRKYLT